ncbi:MAG: xanthine dehydrogenase family protein subunit M [Bacteroidetes bacterium]|nr:xanthine dehydrogenase family protein subunit M [Bacteroidota bacterium]MCW5895325.1 xanthine dehydrogenase family protein subunit M [Bacteroidota bacterium]
MKAFGYIRASTLHEAIGILAHHSPNACLLAGGTDLLIEWRRPSGHVPATVIDISTVAELKGIDAQNGSVSLKPLTTHAELVRSPIVREHASLLASAAGVIGSPQIRNRGTVGGNIMNAAACADTVPPMIALNAEVVLQSASGKRTVPLQELFLKPYETAARHDEILCEIRFEKLAARARSSFIKLGRRNALSISRLSVAAVVARDEAGVITDARIVPGATFPRWRRVFEVEKMLLGEKATAELFKAAGRKVSELMIAETGRRWSTEYKEPVIAVLVQRALEQCCR